MADSEKWRTKAELELMFGKSERTIRRAIAESVSKRPILCDEKKVDLLRCHQWQYEPVRSAELELNC